eukprot:SAG31_NODE_47783_length_218_cov_122.100840_1_plen_62_part_00
MWLLEVFCDMEKTEPLKIYVFATVTELAYVLDVKPSVVYNFYHALIGPRGVLRYVNIYKKL